MEVPSVLNILLFWFAVALGVNATYEVYRFSERPHKRYSYRYPSNLISWFFLAKRHGYVRSLLHNSRTLDMGCGLFKIHSEAVGLDMKPWKNPDVTGSVLDVPLADGQFDSVTLLEVIEHFDHESQERILKEIHRLLKPGGQLVLSMPNISPFWGIPYRMVWSFWERQVMYEYKHEHVGMIPRTELVRLLESNNFKVHSLRRIALLDLVVDCQRV